MALERKELERDLVNRDKQSLISDCLRLFDTNLELSDLNAHFQKRVFTLEMEKESLQDELDTIAELTWKDHLRLGFIRMFTK